MTTSTDGRRLRRERNQQAVIDAVLEMFAEDELVPTIEKVSERTGLSLRTLYRYFPEPKALTEAAIETMMARGAALGHLDDIGIGPFDARAMAFASMRVRLHDQIGSCFRATRHHAPNQPAIAESLERTRHNMTAQLHRQFAREIAALPAAVRAARTTAADVVCQLDSIDVLRGHHGLSVEDTIEVLRQALDNNLVV
ncbi:MAG TPA: TetR/AcrR family transcriptional regulator [Acidimicrobiales bacterium]|nr:TetR/AcrR family transcriptional regulator [Acidimicrobiales bacterium]